MKLLIGILIIVFAAAQENTAPKLSGPNDIANAFYKCGAIDGNIGMVRVLMLAKDFPDKLSWDRVIERLENDSATAHCGQYMQMYKVGRGKWAPTTPVF